MRTCNLLDMKKCSKCQNLQTATVEFFSRATRAKSGLASWCKKCESLHRKIKYAQNPANIIERNKAWKMNNKEYERKYIGQYMVNRLKNDVMFRLASNLRKRTYHAIVQGSFGKKSSLNQYLGCSFEILKKHLESKFQPGMTWENYGEWHVDHITPLSLAKTSEEMYIMCHYTNLQPLWAVQNLSKGAKVS